MKRSSGEVSFDEVAALNHVPLTAALDALDQTQRRTLLFALLDHDLQADSPGGRADSEDEAATIDRHLKMTTVHLPKLVDYGFIDWNQETHEVRKGLKFDEIKPLLELLADHQDDLPDGWM